MAGDAGNGAQAAARQAPLALYRRYRPATFAELKGQDHVTEPLRQALRSGRVNHAYLFSGPRGCGKTSSARILARSLNCEEGPTPDPCGKCASCVALAPSGPGSIDVIEIDAASHGGIDDARDLRERAFYSPVSARYKIYIIDEAHMVTSAGFNALLKLVEEPPPHLKFVFATTEPEKVIPTIRSRTHHYPFRLVPPAVLRELLEEILKAEKIKFEQAILPVVIRAGGGSARDTLSILDQLMAGADESGLRYDRAIALLGYTDDALLDEMVQAFATGDGALVFQAIDRVAEGGHDPRRFAMDLLDRLRDLIVLAAVPDASASGLLDVPEDQLARMRDQAASFGQERMVRAAETISNGLVEMRGATSPRLLLELMCAQVLLPATATAAPALNPAGSAARNSNGDLEGRIDRLERDLRQALDRLSSISAAAIAPASTKPSARDGSARESEQPERSRPPAPADQRPRPDADRPSAGEPDRPESRPPRRQEGGQRQDGGKRQDGGSRQAAPQEAAPQEGSPRREPAPAASGGLEASTLRGRWSDILDAIREVRKVAWILLSSAAIEGVDGDVVTLAFPREGDAKGFSGSGCDQDLANVIERMLGTRPVIRTSVQSASAASASGQSASGQSPSGQSPSGQSASGPSAPGGGSGESADFGGAGDRSESGRPGGGAADETGDRASRERGGGRSEDGDAREGGHPPARQSSRGGGQAEGGGAAKPDSGTSRSRPPSPIMDDPRLMTDAEPSGSGSDVIGSELILRELGGKVIEEISES